MDKIYSQGLNKDALKRWTKDYDIPIKIYEEPYFSYLVQLYKGYFKTVERLDLLKNTMVDFENDDKFLTHNNSLTEKIVETITGLESYKEFINMKMDKFNITSSYPKNDIYKQINTGKMFVSIDLVKANYQALKYVNPEIVLNTENYNEFISEFTQYDYIKESKYIRQVIFGRMNPKRQIKVARYLIELVTNFLLENKMIEETQIAMVSTDEIVFEVSDESAKEFAKSYVEITKQIKEVLNINVDIEVFELKLLAERYYVKEFINKPGYQFACVPQIYFPQVFKKYHGLDIDEKDLVFKYEHQLAKFLNPVV